jgi:hypothetical protein
VARDARDPSLRSAWLATAGVLALLGVLSVTLSAWQRPMLVTSPPSSVVPMELDGWEGEDRRPDRLFLGLASFTHILSRDYARGRQQVNVFVGAAAFGIRHRSFLSPKTRLPTTGFIVEESRVETRGDGEVEVLLVRRGTRRLLIHHWRVGASGLAQETWRAFAGLDFSPLHRETVPVVVRLATPVNASPSGVAAGQRRLEELAGLLEAPLKELATPRG